MLGVEDDAMVRRERMVTMQGARRPVPAAARRGSRGAALIMVLLVLSALAIVGTPFVISMTLQERASAYWMGAVAARQAAEAARNHALARLGRTVYGVEWEAEAEDLEDERPQMFAGDSQGRGSRLRQRPFSQRRAGLVRRADLGDTPRRRGSGNQGRRDRGTRGDGKDYDGTDREEAEIPEALRTSAKGPSPREFDLGEELEAALPDSVTLPRGSGSPVVAAGPPGKTVVGAAPGDVYRFREARGVSASAEITDEQGKVNLNTAPPNLIAALLGASQLKSPLRPQDAVIALVDGSMFRGDADPSTLDGAVVVVHPESNATEAVTYRRKEGDNLVDLNRGAFLSLVRAAEFPVGSFVYDLRGWKLGYHRLWARREGGFHPRELGEFHSVEAMREIAGWQIASLFVSRFRGEGLTLQFLRENGISQKQLAELGLDTYLFGGEPPEKGSEERGRYEAAKRRLRRLGFSAALVKKLEGARGAEVIEDLAARLEKMDRKEVAKTEKELEASLARDRRSAPKIPAGYLKKALEHLAEAYALPGLETLLPEDMEALRADVTVDSHLAAAWSETQSVLDDVSLAAPSAALRVPRASEFNPGTVVRLRGLGKRTDVPPAKAGAEDEGAPEFNEVAPSGAAVPMGGFTLSFPILAGIKGYGTTVQALQRHPVNVNTASRRVLRAVFGGVRGYNKSQAVSLYEADQLAAFVIERRPLKSHDELYALIKAAAREKVIDDDDIEPLLVNAVAPTHNLLRVSTTGFCYASGDIYEIEARGIVRSSAGGEVAAARFREVVEVSPARRLTLGLLTQADFAEGMLLHDPQRSPDFPETHDQFLIPFPGARGHLIQSRPLLIHRVLRAFPGGDLGNLRLLPGESPGAGNFYTLNELYHFRNTFEGLELAPGEPWSISLSLAQDGATGAGGAGGAGGTGGIGGASGGAGAGSGGLKDLTMVPGGIEFWFLMRTYPAAISADGHFVIFDAGSEEERNRLSILYDGRRKRVLLRIHDASLRDPSVVRNQDTGQYLEIAAQRQLDLETWYHLRAVWDGVFGGGAQLFIDGIPAGTDNLSTELVGAIPAAGNIGAISVRDASRFPREGVVRIDGELFEYTRSGSSSLVVRREAQSHFQPLPVSPLLRQQARPRGEIPPPDPDDPEEPRRPGGGRPPAGPGAGAEAAAAPAAGVGEGAPLAAAAGGAPAPLAQAAPQGARGQPSGPRLMRSPWNRRGHTASEHAAGAKVALHGYSLEIRHKLRDPNTNLEMQVPPGDATQIVWGRGGSRLAEPLNAFNFPQGVAEVVHYDMIMRELDTKDEYILPLFEMDEGGGVLGGLGALRASLPQWQRAAGPVRASDFFQSRGVCVVDGEGPFFYRREPLPEVYRNLIIEIHKRRPDHLRIDPSELGQLEGLRILGGYGPNGQALLQRWQKTRQDMRMTMPFPGLILVMRSGATQRSLLASGPIQNLYPPSGILEVRGVPTPWEQALGRPPLAGVPAFGQNPDDIVEWIRYAEIFEGPAGGEQFRLFVGRLGGNFNFRGYPERFDPTLPFDLRNQLDHPAAEPLRLVMELSEGGAGHGDYVTIATRDPRKLEPAVRRVYKVLEHRDGRFFVSLLDVASNGTDIPSSPGIYQNSYTMADEPRLVKFPTWKLPSIGNGSGTFFGDFTAGGAGGSTAGGTGAAGSGRRNAGGLRERGEEDATGITIDEVRRLWNRAIDPNPVGGTPPRYVVVPLEGGSVRFQTGGEGGASISGVIAREKNLSRASPIEVLVVAISRGHSNLIFAENEKEGLIRIGDELFYFEDPNAGDGQGVAGGAAVAAQGTATFAGATGTGVDASQAANTQGGQEGRERDPGARGDIWQISSGSMNGHFEREGFARIEDLAPERHRFFEVFYYRSLGGGFSQCLRGQFGTPITGMAGQGSPIRNVTRRLRLVGRGLLGSQRQAHGLGDPAALVPYATISPITGPVTDTGIPVKQSKGFVTSGGHLLLDPAQPGVPWEIMTHLGPLGDGLLERPRDQQGAGILRSRFGTPLRPITNGMFAYDMPYRYPDRYESEVESESLAYLQKSFRVPGAYWRSLEWLERPARTARERRSDIVVLVRFDGAPDWDAKPTNAPGGLYLFEDRSRDDRRRPHFELDRVADQIELRVYFRFPSGAYSRLGDDIFTDDWKETPILELLRIEYEKAGTIVRHEELPF